MIRIDFDPDKLPPGPKADWEEWITTAKKNTDAVIAAYEDWRAGGSKGDFECKFEPKVWTALKEFLIKYVFREKCAYCETRAVRWPQHAEHFRPKGRVKAKDAKGKLQPQKTKDEENIEITHPGYFWLAYNWKNLVPSCNDCNTAKGKKDQFPVKNAHKYVVRLTPQEVAALDPKPVESPRRPGVYYLEPASLDALEKPLLVHPYYDKPHDHLIFGEFGVVAAREESEKGTQMIEVCDLNNERLRVARQSAQEIALRDYTDEFGKRVAGRSIKDRKTAARQAVGGYLNGEEQYSAAVVDYLAIAIPDFQ